MHRAPRRIPLLPAIVAGSCTLLVASLAALYIVTPALPDALRPDTLASCTGWMVPDAGKRAACLDAEMEKLLLARGVEAIPQIERFADEQPVLGEGCHGAMHRVAPEWARVSGVTAANFREHLPQGTDMNCAAGFTHGVLAHIAGQADGARAMSELRADCSSGLSPLAQKNCLHGFGHAYFRSSGGDVPRAAAMCEQLGGAAAADCAPGVFHERFWGDTGHTRQAISEACTSLPGSLSTPVLRACWSRGLHAAVSSQQRDTFRALAAYCERSLAGAQQQACVTGAGYATRNDEPTDRERLARCAEVSPPLAMACVHGQVSGPWNGAGGTVEQEQALAACAGLGDGVAAACVARVAHVYAVFAHAEVQLCDGLGDTALQRACRRPIERPGATGTGVF